MSSILDKRDGLYNPSLRFAFTNITEEVFQSAWDGRPITVKPGQTVELPHYLAEKMTRELVDKIMMAEIKLDEVEHANGNPYYQSPKGSLLGVPAARKVWEDKIVRQLDVDEESPEIQAIRAEIRAEMSEDLNKKPGVPIQEVAVNPSEFAEIKEGAPVEEKKEKKPLKVKPIK